MQAYAVGDDDGIFYFAMELVDGETMSSILKQKKVIPVNQAVDIVRQIAEALDYAWQEEKLVHRDIKPDNIMLTSSGRAKLADLGLAKVGNETGSTDGEEVMGTPQYISPEQLTGDELDNRTDIYCLGATFYHLLTGRFPYEGGTAVEIARQHLEGTLVPPWQVNPDIPESVSRVVEKMMEKERQKPILAPDDKIYGFMSLDGDYLEIDEIFPLRHYEFEGMPFYGPNKPHAFLTRCYGNYLELPPIDKRTPHYSHVTFFNNE